MVVGFGWIWLLMVAGFLMLDGTQIEKRTSNRVSTSVTLAKSLYLSISLVVLCMTAEAFQTAWSATVP